MLRLFLRTSCLIFVVAILLVVTFQQFATVISAGSHLLLYTDINSDFHYLLDTGSGINHPLAARREAFNMRWSQTLPHLAFMRPDEYPDNIIRYTHNVYSSSLHLHDEQLLIDTHDYTVRSASLGRVFWSPNGRLIAYLIVLEGKTFFAIVQPNGVTLAPMQSVDASAIVDVIWSSDSQSMYLIRRGNNTLTGYRYDLTTETLSTGQRWVIRDERLREFYVSPIGNSILFHENNVPNLYRYDIDNGTMETVVRLEASQFDARVAWAADGSAFATGRINENGDAIDFVLYDTDGTILNQMTYIPDTLWTGRLSLLLSPAPYTVAFTQTGQALCLAEFDDASSRCHTDSRLITPIGFRPK